MEKCLLRLRKWHDGRNIRFLKCAEGSHPNLTWNYGKLERGRQLALMLPSLLPDQCQLPFHCLNLLEKVSGLQRLFAEEDSRHVQGEQLIHLILG